jgi:hypothetical protein
MENVGRNRVVPKFVGLFSVYNGDLPTPLFQSLWSILKGQTESLDLSVGVIEGELSDQLERVVAHFADVQWVRIPKVASALNFGLPECLNKGLEVIGPNNIVLKIDTDDIYDRNRVAVTKRHFLEDDDLVLFGGQVLEWDEEFLRPIGLRRVPLEHDKVYQYGKRRNPFNGPSVAFRSGPIMGLGGFKHVGANEDYVLWSAVLQAGNKSKNIAEVLVHMRGGSTLVHRRSNQRTRKGELEALKAIRAVGYYTRPEYYAHVVFKQVVRRMPHFLNNGIYRILLRSNGSNTVVPEVVLAAKAAFISFQSDENHGS